MVSHGKRAASRRSTRYPNLFFKLVLTHWVHFLVMRLRKPSLGPTNGITFNAMTVLPGDFAREAYGMKELDESGVNGFGISQLLSLPAAFG